MHRNRVVRIAVPVAMMAIISLVVASLFIFSQKDLKVTAAEDCQAFPQTGFSICGRFLDYWKANGGLTQQGYPISNVFEEQNQPPPAGDGKVHKVQYFRRARFEEHLENQPPYDVLLGLLGTEQYQAKYGNQVVQATPGLSIRSKQNVSFVNPDFVPAPGNTFLVLDLAITNSTGRVLPVNPADIRVKTSATYEYFASKASYVLLNSLKQGNLNPGESTGGVLVFEIPSGETPVSLTLTYDTNKVTIPIQ